jgi:hypothetical protein
MKKHEDFFGMSSWAHDGEKSEPLLKTFVDKYGQSVYGELAISSLGSIYLAGRGDLEKASIQFEKIRASKHKVIADEAKRSLAEIARRRTELEKVKNNK